MSPRLRGRRPAGREAEHAAMVADLLLDPANRHGRFGARIHDVTHRALARADLKSSSVAPAAAGYIVLPKVSGADDALTQIEALDDVARTPWHRARDSGPCPDRNARRAARAWKIAALPHVETIDFGLMDFVSAHHGAIPGSAMRSPGQFSHPLVARAKCEIAAAALGNGVIPAHNVTTELNDPDVARDDARRARSEFGFLRMWSIHPRQIQPIVEAMRPDFAEVTEAAGILLAAQNATGARSPGKASCTTAPPTATTGNCCAVPMPPARRLPAEARHVSSTPPQPRPDRCPTDSNERTSPCLKPIANTSPNAPPSASRPCP
jgi:citrate lyase subunit beta/citryl-CoA lyase